MAAKVLTVEERFAGFAGRPLGGYLCGLVADEIGPAAEVRLRRPVATGTPLELRRSGDGTVALLDGEAVVAEGRPGPPEMEVPGSVSFEEAEDASAEYPGRVRHLFPLCFGCGTARGPAEGLRLFPGPVRGREIVAAPWVPHPALADDHGRVPARIVWSSLDCPGLWALIAAAPDDSPEHVVTGSMAADLVGPIEAGRPHVVTAWAIRRDGRRILAGAAVFTEAGELRAVGRQTCVVTDRGVPLGTAAWVR